jgi:hypothetical protein
MRALPYLEDGDEKARSPKAKLAVLRGGNRSALANIFN